MLSYLQEYIPIQNGLPAHIASQNLINNLLGSIGYSVRDGYVIFTEDITDPQGANVNAVDMQLVVMDMDHYSDYDLLPLTAEMAADVVKEVAAMLLNTPMPDNRVDSITEESQNKR